MSCRSRITRATKRRSMTWGSVLSVVRVTGDTGALGQLVQLGLHRPAYLGRYGGWSQSPNDRRVRVERRTGEMSVTSSADSVTTMRCDECEAWGGRASQEGPMDTGLWLQQVVRASQVLAGAAVTCQADGLRDSVDQFLASLPTPRSGLEVVLLRYMAMTSALALAHRLAPTNAQHSVLEAWRAASDVQAMRVAFLNTIGAARSDRPAIARSQIAERASALLQRRYQEPWTLVSLARSVACHPRTLERHFTAAWGTTVAECLRDIRVAAAVQLLTHSDMKIEAIPGLVGFRSRSGFYAAVRKATGVSPLTLRRGTL